MSDAQSLLAALVEQNARDAAYTTNTLIESYRSERDTLAATLKAIRCEFAAAMGGQYMPSPGRLLECIYPSDTTIDEYREG